MLRLKHSVTRRTELAMAELQTPKPDALERKKEWEDAVLNPLLGDNDSSSPNLVEGFGTEDKDSCLASEISGLFTNRYIEVQNKKLTEGDEGCTSLLASNHAQNIASVLTDKSVVIVDKETLKVTHRYQPHEKEITGIKFSLLNPNLVYTSCLDGKLKIWDIRSSACEKVINTNTPDAKKPLTTFDMAPTERIICAGTELIGEDSFLLFWDLRGDKLLGGYWECHSDDITCIKYNPTQPEVLASSGSDGLINVFDVSQPSEEDALTYCLNTEQIVSSFEWSSEQKKQSILAITDAHSIQLWDIEGSAPSHAFSRESLTKSIKRKAVYECYAIPVHYSSFTKNPVILIGSGLEHAESNCIRTVTLNERTGSLEPHGSFVYNQAESVLTNTQAACYDAEKETFITVREDGYISIWVNKNFEQSKKGTFKTPTNIKEKRLIKPY